MIPIKSNARVFVCGKTDSGKTTLVKNVLWNKFPRRIFHDVKLENSELLINSPGTVLARNPTELLNFMSKGGGLDNTSRSILYQPYLADDKEDFNKVCEIIYKFGNFMLVVDEASYYTTGFEIQPFHKEIMMRGRSRGVGIINCSQRPKGCHNLLISEADHFFIFKLTLDDDLKKLKAVIPKKYHKPMETMEMRYFIYSDVSNNNFIHKPIQI